MFAGHVGAALAVGRAERRVNVGVFIAAALLLDVVLWLFVALGWESVSIPANFASSHQAEFVFPYSHGLLASVLWSAIAGAIGLLAYSRLQAAKWRVGLLVAAAVFSHWLLDALVHRPELPLAGAGSPNTGLWLWQDMPIALVVEAAIVVAGLSLFVRGSSLSRGRLIALAVLSLVILAFTVLGMTIGPPPPSALAMAGSSLVALVVVCALACWFGRQTPTPTPAVQVNGRRRTPPPLTRVRRCELPGNALLRRYHDAVSHADCYCIEIRESVPLHAFVEAFYTTALFEIERALLSRVAHRPSTDQEARQLALGTSDTFAAWRVEGRDLDQLLVKAGRTRSWFMVARDSEGAAAGTGTRLYFGSAVVPVVTAAGGARLGLAFHALLGFHALYSRALLRAAASRLARRRGGGAS